MEYEPINYCFMIWTLVLSHFSVSNFFESLLAVLFIIFLCLVLTQERITSVWL